MHERVGDEWVLVNLKTSKAFELNDTGARFWELLTAGGTREEIESTMLAEYDVTGDVLAAELDRLLDELRRAGLVV